MSAASPETAPGTLPAGFEAGYDDLAIEAQNLTRMYGEEAAVDDLSMVVPRGSIFGFIGPSGSGKTSTCLLYTSPSPRDRTRSRMPSSA